MKPPTLQTKLAWLLEIALFSCMYYLTARLSLLLSFENTNASPFWLPSAVGFATVLFRGYRLWPSILIGAFLANSIVFLTNHFSNPASVLLISLSIGLGNTLEAVCGAYLFRRWIGLRNPLDRLQDVFKFIPIIVLMCLIGSLVGPTFMYLSKAIDWQTYLTVWLTWWVGDMSGVLLLSPLLLTHIEKSSLFSNMSRWFEAGIFLILLLSLNFIIFGGKTVASISHSPLDFMIIPFVIWAAFRFGRRGVALTLLITLSIAIWGTTQGFGPFIKPVLNDSLLILQLFIIVMNVTGLILSVALIERKRADDRLQKSLQDLADFTENANVGMHWTGPNGRILWTNQAELDMLGYTREEYIGRHIGQVYVDATAAEDMFRRLSHNEILHNYETQLYCKDGSIKDVSIHSSVLWERGKFVHTRCFTHDITDRKNTERLQKEFQDKLALEKHKMEQVLSIEEGLHALVSMNKLIDFIVEKTVEVMEAERCSLILVDAQTQELCIKGHTGLNEDIIKNNRSLVDSSLASQVAYTRNPVLVTDIESDPRFMRKNKTGYKSKSFMIAPLTVDHTMIGLLSVTDKKSDKNPVFSEMDLKILMMISRLAAAALEKAKIYQELYHLRVTDPMTEIYNYRHFVRNLDYEIKRSSRYQQPLCLLVIDIDDLKSYNKSFGYKEGDNLLKEVGRLLTESSRDVDIVCRYAGDEFVLILPNTAIEEAKIVATKIIKKAPELNLKKSISLSIGAAKFNPPMSRYDFVRKMATALFEAKRNGQDHMCLLT